MTTKNLTGALNVETIVSGLTAILKSVFFCIKKKQRYQNKFLNTENLQIHPFFSCI